VKGTWKKLANDDLDENVEEMASEYYSEYLKTQILLDSLPY
jgi:hypothetical protein